MAGLLAAAIRSSIVSSASRSESFVMATARFLVLPVSVGRNVTDFVAIRKSPGFWGLAYSVAVPVFSTSTANVVGEPGRWLTVTGTFSMLPETFSSTDAACFEVPAASVPNATLASSSPSSMVTVAVAPEDAAFQPETDVDSVASNVSSPSTRSSSASGTVSVAVLLFAATVTEVGVVPVSSADALPE